MRSLSGQAFVFLSSIPHIRKIEPVLVLVHNVELGLKQVRPIRATILNAYLIRCQHVLQYIVALLS